MWSDQWLFVHTTYSNRAVSSRCPAATTTCIDLSWSFSSSLILDRVPAWLCEWVGEPEPTLIPATWDPELEVVWLLAIEVTLHEERSSDLGRFDFITTRRSSVSTLVEQIKNLELKQKAFACKALKKGFQDRIGEREIKTAPADRRFNFASCFPLPKDWTLDKRTFYVLLKWGRIRKMSSIN